MNDTTIVYYTANEAPRSKLRGIRAEFLRSQPHFAKASLGVPLAPSSSKLALRFSAKGNKISDYFFQNTKKQLLLAAQGRPIISITRAILERNKEWIKSN